MEQNQKDKLAASIQGAFDAAKKIPAEWSEVLRCTPHEAPPAPPAAGEAGERWEVLTQEQRAAIQQAAEAWRPFQHGKPPEVTVGEYIRAQIDYERAVGPDVVLGTIAYVEHLEARLHAAEAAQP